MQYDGILFDLDGTLWDATEAIAVSWELALQDAPDVEAPPTREQLEQVMGMTAEDLMATLFPQLSPQRHQELFARCCQVENDYLRRHGGKLYPHMEETLREVQGQPMAMQELATRVDLKVDAFLPGDYVHDERQRMEMYKRIASLRTDIEREDIEEEMIDRFGDLPAPVVNLLDIAQLRALAQGLGVAQVIYRAKGQLVMRLDQRYIPDPQLLTQAMMDTDKRLSLTPTQPVSLMLRDPKLGEGDMLLEGVKVLKQLSARLDQLKKQKEKTESKA